MSYWVLRKELPEGRDLISFASEAPRLAWRGTGWLLKDSTSPNTRPSNDEAIERDPEVLKPRTQRTLLNPTVPIFIYLAEESITPIRLIKNPQQVLLVEHT